MLLHLNVTHDSHQTLIAGVVFSLDRLTVLHATNSHTITPPLRLELADYPLACIHAVLNP